MHPVSQYLRKLKYAKKDDFYETEKFFHEVEYQLISMQKELAYHSRRSIELSRFLQEIDGHPSLQAEWKRFRLLYKTITGNEPPLTKSR